jgi:hypothetical protein
MPDERDDKFLDELLEASLRHYSDALPREGLEGRVLAQLRSARAAKSRRKWDWALAVGVTAVVVIIAGIAIRKPVPGRPMTALPHASESQRMVENPPVGPPAALRTAPARDRLRPGKRKAQLADAHWPEQFPIPAPLSEQEKLLLAYARWMASSAPKGPAVEEQQDKVEIPLLTITALNISPLEGEKDKPEK